MSWSRTIIRGSLLVLAGLTVRDAGAARRGVVLADPPQPLRLRLLEEYLETNVEAEQETQTAGSPGITVKRQRLLVQSEAGVGIGGSVYHPNLLAYRFTAGLGLDWQSTSLSPGGSGSSANLLQRYHGSLDILREKPYSASFYADKDMTYRDYDIFSRVRVDSERYGFRSGYTAGPVPFTIALQHYEEQEAALTRPSSRTDDTISFNASNNRHVAQGSTQLSYNLNEYARTESGFNEDRALNQSLSVFDTERFGKNDRVRLTSALNYNSVTETTVPTERVSLQESLELQHTPRLRSMYEYSIDNSTAGDSDSLSQQGRAGLTHQLYENLTSSLEVHGSRSTSTSPGSALTASRVGVGLSEQYTRQLGRWGNLSLGYDGRLDHEERDASGSTLVITDESHVLADSTHSFLNQPLVDTATIHVTDSTGTITYIEGLDYLVQPQGLLTEIRRIPGGNIIDGGIVLVDYSATLQPSAAYDSLANSYNFRLNLFDGLAGFYARWSTLDFYGASQLVLQTFDDRVVGVDTNWRWLHAGGEYEVMDSNLAPYERVRLFQSLHFRPNDYSALSIDFDENWTTFKGNNTRQTSYGMIARYEQFLTRNLSLSTEGGIRIERGDSFDRDYGTSRTELNLAVGKLTVKLGYEYNNESHRTDQRERHFLFMRARREL